MALVSCPACKPDISIAGIAANEHGGRVKLAKVECHHGKDQPAIQACWRAESVISQLCRAAEVIHGRGERGKRDALVDALVDALAQHTTIDTTSKPPHTTRRSTAGCQRLSKRR
jgi:hypothetical protein